MNISATQKLQKLIGEANSLSEFGMSVLQEFENMNQENRGDFVAALAAEIYCLRTLLPVWPDVPLE